MSQGGKAKQTEIQKAVAEHGALQARLINANAQLESQKMLVHRSKLTLADLNDMPENVVTYRAVGRMFMKADCNAIKSEIAEILETSAQEAAKLDKAKTILDGQLQQATKTIREMIEASNPDKSS